MLESIAHFCGALDRDEGLFFEGSSPAVVEVNRAVGPVDEGGHIASGGLAVNTGGQDAAIGKGAVGPMARTTGYAAVSGEPLVKKEEFAQGYFSLGEGIVFGDTAEIADFVMAQWHAGYVAAIYNYRKGDQEGAEECEADWHGVFSSNGRSESRSRPYCRCPEPKARPHSGGHNAENGGRTAIARLCAYVDNRSLCPALWGYQRGRFCNSLDRTNRHTTPTHCRPCRRGRRHWEGEI